MYRLYHTLDFRAVSFLAVFQQYILIEQLIDQILLTYRQLAVVRFKMSLTRLKFSKYVKNCLIVL